MAETKGIVIQFKGDTIEFDRSVDGVNRSLKTLKNEMSQINKQLKLDPTNVDLLKSKFSNLKEQQKVVKEQLTLYKEELAKLKDSEIGSKRWVELQKKIGDTEVELQKLNKQTDNMSKMNFELVSFGNKMTDASKKTQELANSLKGVSMVGASVLGTLGALTMKAASNADDINTLAKEYNLTTDEIQKFQLASELIDVDMTTITKSYSKLTKAMTSNSKDTQEAFKTLGIATKDANGNLRDSNEVFNELIGALGKVDNETEQDALAMQIFGKSAAELGPLINGGSEALAEFSNYLEENNLILSEDELNSLNSMKDAFDKVKATLSAFANKIAVTYAPMIQKALEKVNEIILRLKEKWEQLSPNVKEAIPKIAAIVAAISPAISIFGKLQGTIGKVTKLIGMGGGGLGGILKALTGPVGIIIGLFALMYTTNEDFRNSINDLVGELWNELQPILNELLSTIGDLLGDLIKFLMPIIEKLADWLIKYIIPAAKKIIEAIMPVLNKVLDVLCKWIMKIVEWIGDLWDFLEDIGVIDLFSKAFEGLGKVIETVTGWVSSLFDWFGNLIDRAKEFLGIQDQIKYEDQTHTSSSGSSHAGHGGSFSGGFGEMASGGFVLNNTINISSNRTITKNDVIGWADIMTNRINENLGRMM